MSSRRSFVHRSVARLDQPAGILAPERNRSMRTRLTGAVVLVFLSLGILGAQAPQQPDGQSSAEERLRRSQRLLQVMSDPVIKKQLELAQAMAEAAEVAR